MNLIVTSLLAALLPQSASDSPNAVKLQERLLVVNKAESSACILELASGKISHRFETGEGPHEVVLSPSGRWAVISDYGKRSPSSSLTVLDLHHLKRHRTIELGEYERPHGLVFQPDGRLLVTAESHERLLKVDLDRGEITASVPTNGRVAHMVAIDAQGRRGFVANSGTADVSVIDLQQDRWIKKIATGAGAQGIASHPQADEIWVTHHTANSVVILDSDRLEIVAEIPCERYPIRIAFTPDGRLAVVPCILSSDVAILDCETRRVVARVAIPDPPLPAEETSDRISAGRFGDSPVPVGVLISPKGDRAFVSNTLADTISVIDLEARQVVRTLRAGKGPDGMLWLPAANSRD